MDLVDATTRDHTLKVARTVLENVRENELVLLGSPGTAGLGLHYDGDFEVVWYLGGGVCGTVVSLTCSALSRPRIQQPRAWEVLRCMR